MGGAQYPDQIRALYRIDRERARRRRRPVRRSEVAAAIGLVLAGVATIAGIVLVSPAWQRIFVAWRAGAAQPATAASPGIVPRTDRELAPSPPVQTRPSRPPAQADTTQVMASLLVSQLGHDPAWRTAVANADAHAADSPEHAYWRSVAAAIRDVAHRLRP